ncbi:MAG: DUF222 domain-containing protein [Acidimicrobiales bacterium]
MRITEELRNQALAVAGSVDPELMSGAQAAVAVEDLAVAEKALAGTLMFVALRVARTDAWRNQGFASAADWLASKAGVSVHEAHRQLGTAKRADRLPKTKDAMKRGDLSPDQADAVTDAAAADPAAEDDLLDTAARDTHRKLREEAAKRKAAATDARGRERRVHAQRSKRSWTDADGAFHLHLRGPAADGVRIEALLRPFEEQAFRAARGGEVRDTFENRAYDAFLAALGVANSSAIEPAAPAGAPARVPGGNNTKVIVNVDHAALLRGHTVAGETAHVAGVGPVPVAAIREILRDDPFLAVVVRKGRDVVSVAHHGRGLNAAQRTAIEADGIRCSNIACNRTVAIEIDHRVPYAADPVTDLANQDPLCPNCHRLKTHHGHHLEPGRGRRRLLPRGSPGPEPPTTRAAPEPPLRPPRNGERPAGPHVDQPSLC